MKTNLTVGGKFKFLHLKCKNLLGGRPTKVANLNEQQATFLITLLRNNNVVPDFKAELVERFFKMREKNQSRFYGLPLNAPNNRQQYKTPSQSYTGSVNTCRPRQQFRYKG